MKTTSINVCSLCVPCHCHCRYCLLSYNGALPGADYGRSELYARRFNDWLKENRPELGFAFYFGYSMEHPRLFEAIDFMQSIGSPGGKFLQFDGMAFRPEAELQRFLKKLKDSGIELIDLTFYGVGEYHDRFAGRRGDFDYLLSVLRAANTVGLDVQAGMPITHENAPQADGLLAILSQYRTVRRSIFIPHSEGRGVTLEPIRFTQPDHDFLSAEAKSLINTARFKSEGQWIKDGHFSKPEKRVLTLNLTAENIDSLENQDFSETVAFLERLDDDHYSAIPSMDELAKLYGDEKSELWYSERDLYLAYQRRYINENKLEVYNMNDESHHFSRRI